MPLCAWEIIDTNEVLSWLDGSQLTGLPSLLGLRNTERDAPLYHTRDPY